MVLYATLGTGLSQKQNSNDFRTTTEKIGQLCSRTRDFCMNRNADVSSFIFIYVHFTSLPMQTVGRNQYVDVDPSIHHSLSTY